MDKSQDSLEFATLQPATLQPVQLVNTTKKRRAKTLPKTPKQLKKAPKQSKNTQSPQQRPPQRFTQSWEQQSPQQFTQSWEQQSPQQQPPQRFTQSWEQQSPQQQPPQQFTQFTQSPQQQRPQQFTQFTQSPQQQPPQQFTQSPQQQSPQQSTVIVQPCTDTSSSSPTTQYTIPAETSTPLELDPMNELVTGDEINTDNWTEKYKHGLLKWYHEHGRVMQEKLKTSAPRVQSKVYDHGVDYMSEHYAYKTTRSSVKQTIANLKRGFKVKQARLKKSGAESNDPDDPLFNIMVEAFSEDLDLIPPRVVTASTSDTSDHVPKRKKRQNTGSEAKDLYYQTKRDVLLRREERKEQESEERRQSRKEKQKARQHKAQFFASLLAKLP